jgi:hypothetical protein
MTQTTPSARAPDDENGDVYTWIIANLGDEPDAVADDESLLIPIKWEPGRGFVKRG